MKKLLFVIVAIILILTACSPKEVVIIEPTAPAFNQLSCDRNWETLDAEDDNIVWMVDYLLNTKHPPDSIGAYLAECIEAGWTGWR